VIAPAVAGLGGKLRVRPVGVTEWLSARVSWDDADADAALVVVEDEGWKAPARQPSPAAQDSQGKPSASGPPVP